MIEGYVAVYSNKIVEKKKRVKEIYFDHVIKIRYFKKPRDNNGTITYMDCLHFYLKDQDDPVLINISKGIVMPYNTTKEMSEILSYILKNFPSIHYTKEEMKALNWM